MSASYLGCTTEFRKWEGITYDSKNKKIYTALSAVQYGMEDNATYVDKKKGTPIYYDVGGRNHLKMKANKCGCVMEMEVDENFLATKAKMLVCGVVNVDPATKVPSAACVYYTTGTCKNISSCSVEKFTVLP